MTESPWDVALRAADVLAPESTALSNPDDVAQLGDALVKVIRQAVGDPAHVFNVGAEPGGRAGAGAAPKR